MLVLMTAMMCTAQSASKTSISAVRQTGSSGLPDVSSSIIGAEKINPSSSMTFTCGTSTATDADGNVYSTVQIGDQCWLGENLKVGVMIPGSTGQTNNGIIEKHCYGDNPSNCNTYGGLYQWNELMQYAGDGPKQGICPVGWHIPTSAEWTWLSYLLLNDAGGRMKSTGTFEAGTGLWYAPNTLATNSSGFNALPGGWKNDQGNFASLGFETFFFTSSGWYYCCAYFVRLRYDDALMYSNYTWYSNSSSVRCLKNPATLPTVSTSSISAIAEATAVGGGNVTNDGGADINARGVVWSTTQNPTVTTHEGITTDGTGTGEFTSNLTSLAAKTRYYVKAYATNNIGTSYGLQVEFMTAIPSILALSGLTINTGTVTCFDATQSITVSNFTVKTGGNATFISGGNIVLQPATTVENGGYLRASITTNAGYCLLTKSMLTINEEELPKEMITMEMKEASALFTVSPNPATSAFTLEVFDFEAAQTIQVEIYSMMGERVIQTSVIGQKQYKFDVTDWPKGVYIVRVMAGNKMGVEKLIKQ